MSVEINCFFIFGYANQSQSVLTFQLIKLMIFIHLKLVNDNILN